MMSYGAIELDDTERIMDALPSSKRIIKIAV